ncbi:Increased dna methylation [Thalictrum thalictroides]|uniref:Increased dna methylation n=1 Tax=Thalictrum thalictroides TaxID=46969 RepID=A0A7J6XA23_THATH|nr:Increased dna methylation [Thalictrum thalictroides]
MTYAKLVGFSIEFDDEVVEFGRKEKCFGKGIESGENVSLKKLERKNLSSDSYADYNVRSEVSGKGSKIPNVSGGFGLSVKKKKEVRSSKVDKLNLLDVKVGELALSVEKSKGSSKGKLVLKEDPDWSPQKSNVVRESWNLVHSHNPNHSLEGDDAVNVSRPVVQALPAVGSGLWTLGEIKTRTPRKSTKRKHTLQKYFGVYVRKPVVQALPALGWTPPGLSVSTRKRNIQRYFIEEDGAAGVSEPIVQAIAAPHSLKDIFSSSGWKVSSGAGGTNPIYVSPSGSVYESLLEALKAFSQQNSKCKVECVSSQLAASSRRSVTKKSCINMEIQRKNSSASEPTDSVVPEKADADLQQDKKLHTVKGSVLVESSHSSEDDCLSREKNGSEYCSVVRTLNEQNNNDKVHLHMELQGLRRSDRINGRHVPVDCEFDMEMFDGDDDFDLSNSVCILRNENLPESYDLENDKASYAWPGRMKFKEVYEVLACCVAEDEAQFCDSVDKMVQNMPSSYIPGEGMEDSPLSDFIIHRVPEVVTLSMEDERGNSCSADACLNNGTTKSDSGSVLIEDGLDTDSAMYQDGPLVGTWSSTRIDGRHIAEEGETDIAKWGVDESRNSYHFVIAGMTKENQSTTISQEHDFQREPPTIGNNILLKETSPSKLDSQKPENQLDDLTLCQPNPVATKTDEIKTSVSKKCSPLLKRNLVPKTRVAPSASKRKSTGGGGRSRGKRKRKRSRVCGLRVRRTGKAERVENVLIETKLTILSWLIDMGTMVENEKVVYNTKNGKGKMLKGCVTRGGIWCNCCKKVLSLLEFEAHAGSNLHQAWNNTCLMSGKSLMQCQSEAWDQEKKQKKIGFKTVGVGDTDCSDDMCAVCCDGGHLMCCDGCPSTFHQECLMLKSLPDGNWYCPFCTCAFCMRNDCGQDICNGTMKLLSCDQCGCKYHMDCVCENDLENMGSMYKAYCGKHCEKLDLCLSQILGIKSSIGGNFAWTLLRRLDEEAGGSNQKQSYITECNVKLSLALLALYECFDPLVDSRTGLDMIVQAVYSCGSNFNRLNYEGFYTVILEKDEEIISVATLRLHGTRVAEMPFIGTRPIYRRQGMCRRLLQAIEEMLSSFHVEKLIIPAIPDLLETWMTSFSFKPLEPCHHDEIRNLSMVLFAETTLLQKPIYNRPTLSDGNQVGVDSNVGKIMEGSQRFLNYSNDVTISICRSSEYVGQEFEDALWSYEEIRV